LPGERWAPSRLGGLFVRLSYSVTDARRFALAAHWRMAIQMLLD
jgi:hypothetical protein